MTKTFLKKHPFGKNIDESVAYVVLDEKETSWLNDKKNVCHDLMKKSIKDQSERLTKKHKKTIVFLDCSGRVRHTRQYHGE